jgi:hypothetical protein
MDDPHYTLIRIDKSERENWIDLSIYKRRSLSYC